MKDLTPNLAYLLLTEWDVANHPDLADAERGGINASLLTHAALYAHRTGCSEAVLMGDNPTMYRLLYWSDLEEVIDHARRTCVASTADGWLPTEPITPPF